MNEPPPPTTARRVLLTTLLGRPFAVRLRDRATIFAFLLVTSATIAGLVGARTTGDLVMGTFTVVMACGWMYVLLGSSLPGRLQRRLVEFAGRLCLRCGRECTSVGERLACSRCGISVQSDFVYERWGWLTPSPPGADESRRITIHVGTPKHGDGTRAVLIIVMIVMAIALLPLGFVFDWKGYVPSALLTVSGISLWRPAEEPDPRRSLREKRICPGCGYSLSGHEDWRCPECGLRVVWDESSPPKPPARCPRRVRFWFLLTLTCASFAGAGVFGALFAYHESKWNGLVASIVTVPLRSTNLVRQEMESTRRWRAEAIEALVLGDRWERISIMCGTLTCISWLVFFMTGARARAKRERTAWVSSESGTPLLSSA